VATPRDRHPVVQLLRHVDLLLVVAPILLAAIGAVMVYSATRLGTAEPRYYLDRQIAYAVVGIVVMIVVAAIDYRRYEEWGYLLYGLAVLALAAVFAVGTAGNVVTDGTSVRWFSFGPVQLQPSEIGVLGVIVGVAVYLSRHQEHLDIIRVVVLVAMVGVPMLLVFKQPDLGTTIILAMVFATMLVVGGLRIRLLALLGLCAVVGVVGAVHFGLLHAYQIARVTAFVNQNSNTASLNYQLIWSKTAIAGGGMHGQGILHGYETNIGGIPNQSTDFIFTAVGEQLGFVGSAVVLGLFALIAFRVIRAVQVARDPFGRLLCAGVLAFLVFSVFQNVGMTIGITPITGIPLPFMSYGGTALVSFFAAIGLAVNVGMRRGVRRAPRPR
jgi:rod shape determining protein RodA